MKVKFNYLYEENKKIKKEFLQKLNQVFKNSNFINGKYNKIFEKKFAKKNNIKYCHTLANGTDALYLGVKTLLKKKKNEVITSAHSWISTASSIQNAGAVPIFCDTDENFSINADLIENKITKKTEGVIIVHLFGKPCNMKKILELKKKYKFWLIEDCSQAHFAKYNNKAVGTFGDIGIFSFYPSKNIGAIGDAGAIITNNFRIYKDIKQNSLNGSLNKIHFPKIGINSRMDNIQALFLINKLKNYQEIIKKKKKLANIYLKLLSSIKQIKLPDIKNSVLHQFVIIVEKRNKLKRFLKSKNIDTLIHYPKILPENNCFNVPRKRELFQNAYSHSKKILSLPICSGHNSTQIKYVSKKIIKFYAK